MIDYDKFVEALYSAGWDSPCDAQHSKIKEIWCRLVNEGLTTYLPFPHKSKKERMNDPRFLALTLLRLATILTNALSDTRDACVCKDKVNETCWICDANEILKELGYIK